MLTASVNLVQSAWPDDVQGDISGVSRSVSNLGSSLGVAVAGSLIATATADFTKPFVVALVVMAAFALIGKPVGWKVMATWLPAWIRWVRRRPVIPRSIRSITDSRPS